jgi:hypothetical protein
MADKFNVMLLKISSDLHPKDLEQLIYICKIEESRKANITSGYHLFTHLRHDRRISEDNVAYLKDILNTIRRCDLVHHVERFEGVGITNTGFSHENAVLNKTPSGEMNRNSTSNQREIYGVENIERSGNPFVKILPQSLSGGGTNTTPCCAVNWPCVSMSCYKIHICYVILIVLYILAIVIVSLLWYAHVPMVSEHLREESSVYDSGKFVIIAIILTIPIFLLIVFFARKYWKKRHVTRTASTSVDPDVAMKTKNEDSVTSVVANVNPNCNCDLELGDEHTPLHKQPSY